MIDDHTTDQDPGADTEEGRRDDPIPAPFRGSAGIDPVAHHPQTRYFTL